MLKEMFKNMYKINNKQILSYQTQVSKNFNINRNRAQ